MEEKIQRLSEGMDFLEEALGYGEPLEYTEVSESIISESNGSNPSPYKILGRCSGNFQPIGEFSRNKRLYSENLWPTVLQNEELKSRLAHRAVFGCLGHADKLVDDRDVQEGKVSHIVTKLEVRKDKNTGKPFLYGELEILDTPAGRILEAMYKGGADLYVSSRAAGKLFPVPGQDYSLIKPEQYVVHTFDIVCRPGFIKARPMFEASPSESSQVSEAQVLKLSGNMVEIEKGKEVEHPEEEDKKEKHSKEKANEADTSIEELNNKINQLAKIIEKVVDDVYEDGTQSIEEQLGELLLDPSVSESAFEDVISILKESKPELVNSIMENSRKKFNQEHGEKSGLEIEYYRFAGKHPYKIVPKGTDYFAASHDSPTYRTLKQAQKHVLDSYNKPKEGVSEEVKYHLSKGQKEDLLTPVYGAMNTKRMRKGKKTLSDEQCKKKALPAFIKIMAESNITEEAFSEIIDMIKGDLS